ncbi:MAG: valine--tRNA ligase [Candidatus Altiarchaeota archaeon]|nr:valine--tRNA ligase [Candidatus Altiarchaeota archaeon]
MLDKNYTANALEKKWQARWLEDKANSFNPKLDKPVYSLDTPPPFTSGTLHMGHVYNHVWIDIVARYKRMRGFNVYLPQGFDCHGLPTELQVEKNMGVPKEDRKKFIAECIKWTENAVSRMKSQFESLGYSTDWDYSYRTMDDDYKRMVQKSLLIFYQKGMLYREKHPVLWCPNCGTALAKAEVGYIEKEGKLYHIDLEAEGHKLTIATTRPEMMPACVAVFVHPDDGRYARFVGKKAKLPLFNRDVPIFSDSAVDMEFGTGVVYLCTFGDEQDIAWQKQYDLPVIEAIGRDGLMTAAAGVYSGLPVKEARDRMVADLENIGVVRKVEKLVHKVTSHTERGSCKAPIELLPTEQWFIKVKEYLQDIIQAANTMKWHPDYMLQRLVDWTESMDWDWIISRQRVFGTPIPFWVCSCGEVVAAKESELPIDPRDSTRKCPKCGGKAKGETDVCDCWVDSSVSPLRVSQWGVDDEFFAKTYPVSLRPQGYEIIRTWTFYTIFRDLMLTGKPCFKDLMINGMVAGPDGRKMSKSLNNIIAPEEPLSKYSADALRQWAACGSLGSDYPFSWEECEHSQKFLTKFWNISRFIEMHLADYDGSKGELRAVDKWILGRLSRIVDESTESLDNYVFNIPLDQIRGFVWHDLADDYLEMVKHRLYKPEIYGAESRRAAQYTLHAIMSTLLRLMSPYMPHIADEIWANLMKDGYASAKSWPVPSGEYPVKDYEQSGMLAKSIVSDIRKFKSENNMSLGAELSALEVRIGKGRLEDVRHISEDIKGTGKIKELKVVGAEGDAYELVFQK